MPERPIDRERFGGDLGFEALGQRDRARQLYSELAAADTSDFYRRNALARLARWKAPGWMRSGRSSATALPSASGRDT